MMSVGNLAGPGLNFPPDLSRLFNTEASLTNLLTGQVQDTPVQTFFVRNSSLSYLLKTATSRVQSSPDLSTIQLRETQPSKGFILREHYD